MDTPSATVKVDFVRIQPGQTLTIYAVPDVTKGDSIQLELRVMHDGKIELFCDEALIPRPFAEWRMMEKTI